MYSRRTVVPTHVNDTYTLLITIAFQVEAVLGHTLFNPDHLLKLNGGKPTLNMTGFQTLVSKAGAPKKPKETPDSLPPFPKSIQSPDVKVFDDVPSLAGRSFYFWILIEDIFLY